LAATFFKPIQAWLAPTPLFFRGDLGVVVEAESHPTPPPTPHVLPEQSSAVLSFAEPTVPPAAPPFLPHRPQSERRGQQIPRRTWSSWVFWLSLECHPSQPANYFFPHVPRGCSQDLPKRVAVAGFSVIFFFCAFLNCLLPGGFIDFFEACRTPFGRAGETGRAPATYLLGVRCGPFLPPFWADHCLFRGFLRWF